MFDLVHQDATYMPLVKLSGGDIEIAQQPHIQPEEHVRSWHPVDAQWYLAEAIVLVRLWVLGDKVLAHGECKAIGRGNLIRLACELVVWPLARLTLLAAVPRLAARLATAEVGFRLSAAITNTALSRAMFIDGCGRRVRTGVHERIRSA
jgi:hypothetical protein